MVFKEKTALVEYGFLPGYVEDIKVEDIVLRSQLTESIFLNTPIVSAFMHDVTNAKIAIALAEFGGLGGIPQSISIAMQQKYVRTTKNYDSEGNENPITIASDKTVQDYKNLSESEGYVNIPVVDGGKLVGLMTPTIVSATRHLDTPIKETMLKPYFGNERVDPKEFFYCGNVNKVLIGQATEIMHSYDLPLFFFLNDDDSLHHVLFYKDYSRKPLFQKATKDNKGKLMVAGAISTHPDYPARLEALLESGVDIIGIDSSHGYSRYIDKTMEDISEILKEKGIPLMVGNITTKEAFYHIAELGKKLDLELIIKTGYGAGDSCISRDVLLHGIPNKDALEEVVAARDDYLKKTGRWYGVIIDGGMGRPGIAAIGLTMGADAVMIGTLIGGFKESPAEEDPPVADRKEGEEPRVKWVRGEAYIEESNNNVSKPIGPERYDKGWGEVMVEEGERIPVEYRGSIYGFGKKGFPAFINGMKDAIRKAGYKSITEIRDAYQRKPSQVVFRKSLATLFAEDPPKRTSR